jgi:hypothetical protein
MPAGRAGELMLYGVEIATPASSSNAKVDKWKSPGDGYLIITKTSNYLDNIPTYVFDITLLEDLT